MRQKKFPFLTVPFVAQWYYNGQSVHTFHSVCSSALPVTLELDCRPRCRLVRENDVVKVCLCLVKMTTGKLQALSLVGFADELAISTAAKRPASCLRQRCIVAEWNGTARPGMTFPFCVTETETFFLTLHLYTCECLAILPNSLRESDIRGPLTDDLVDITAVGSEKTAKSSTLSLPSSLGIWPSENYWHCHHAIITDL